LIVWGCGEMRQFGGNALKDFRSDLTKVEKKKGTALLDKKEKRRNGARVVL